MIFDKGRPWFEEHERQRLNIRVRNWASVLGFALMEAAILTAHNGRWIGVWPAWLGAPPILERRGQRA
jgi:hypothetical protein